MDISDFAEHGRTRTRACTEKEFVSLIFQVIKQELYFLFAYLRDAVHRVRRPPTFGKRWITHVGCKFYDPFESIYCYQDGGSKARTCKYDAAGPCFTGRAVHCWTWKSWRTHTHTHTISARAFGCPYHSAGLITRKSPRFQVRPCHSTLHQFRILLVRDFLNLFSTSGYKFR